MASVDQDADVEKEKGTVTTTVTVYQDLFASMMTVGSDLELIIAQKVNIMPNYYLIRNKCDI